MDRRCHVPNSARPVHVGSRRLAIIQLLVSYAIIRFSHIFEQHLSILADILETCNEPGYSTCKLDEKLLRKIYVDEENKILKVGYQLFREGSGNLMSYNYNSYIVKDRNIFNARARLYTFDKEFQSSLQSCERQNSITDLPSLARCNQIWGKMEKMLTVLFSVHLTTFANILMPDDKKIIETSYSYDASADNLDTIRKRYYYDEQHFFYNSRGQKWKEFGSKMITNYTEYLRDNKYIYLKFVERKVKIPIDGGTFFHWNKDDEEWTVSGEVTKKP